MDFDALATAKEIVDASLAETGDYCSLPTHVLWNCLSAVVNSYIVVYT